MRTDCLQRLGADNQQAGHDRGGAENPARRQRLFEDQMRQNKAAKRGA